MQVNRASRFQRRPALSEVIHFRYFFTLKDDVSALIYSCHVLPLLEKEWAIPFFSLMTAQKKNNPVIKFRGKEGLP